MTVEKEYVKKFMEVAEELFEFAFDRKTIRKKISDQDIALGQHIVKIQLYNESTAYQTVYDIYDLFMDVKDVDRNNILTKESLMDLLSSYISDEEDWNRVVKTVKRKMPSKPSIEYTSSFMKYNHILEFIVNLVADETYVERNEFYIYIRTILERNE